MEIIDVGELNGIRVLSLFQPWVWCIFHAGKDVENRMWKPIGVSYPFRLAIHAGKNLKQYEQTAGDLDETAGIVVPDKSEAVTGAIVGVVDVMAIETRSTSKWAAPDQFHWMLANPRLLKEPFPCRGYQKIFHMDGVTPRMAVMGRDE